MIDITKWHQQRAKSEEFVMVIMVNYELLGNNSFYDMPKLGEGLHFFKLTVSLTEYEGKRY